MWEAKNLLGDITICFPQIDHLQDEQAHLDQQLEENQSEANQKFRELRKREENMDAFVASFDENKA